MSNVRASIESTLFKQAADGSVFRAPNPWVFGEARHYLVNEAKKAEILAIVTPRRPMLRAAVIIIALLLWVVAVATLVWAFGSGQDDPTASDIAVMTILIVVPMVLALLIALRLKLRRLQPVLAGLPRTHERITAFDLRQGMVNSTSFKKLLLLGALFTASCLFNVFSLVMRNARHPLFGDGESYLLLFVVLALALPAASYFALAIRKARQMREAN